MKSLSLVAIFVTLAIVASAKQPEPLAAQPRSVSSIIVDAMESLRPKMEKGWPEYGIPPLAPLTMQHKNFKFETGELRAAGALDELVIQGLNEFEIRVMQANLLSSRIKFELNFASLNVTSHYKADVGIGFHMQRDGGAFLALEDLNLSGQIKYSTGLLGSNSFLRIKEIKLNMVAGNVVSKIENLSKYRIMNRKLNEIVEEFITLTINDNVDFVARWLDSKVTPICNDLIGERSIKDVLEIIGGGN